MERVFAFTDESGAFGWDFQKQGVSTHFVISAIIVKENDLDELRVYVEAIRKKYFQTGEMKSSHIGSNHARRAKILTELNQLPFSVFTVIIDKRKLTSAKGLKYKKSFYKFMNNIVHKELRRAFSKLTIVADEIGGSDYMQSFCAYVDERQDIPNLLGEANFFFEVSHNEVLIQLADFICGTFAQEYDDSRKTDKTPAYHKMLQKQIIRTEFYPREYDSYTVEDSAIAEGYDTEVATLCYRQAVNFITLNEDNEDETIQAQVLILKYLLFRFMNNDLRTYISTKELKAQLRHTELADISTHTFRTKIISKLRDSGVIIASSSPKKGYKIPSTKQELYDFVNHGTSIIIPMLSRLKKCRDLVKLGTVNELDLFELTEYSQLKHYFDEEEVT